MSRLHLIDGRLRAGVWRAVILSEAKLENAPSLEILHDGVVLSGVAVDAAGDGGGQHWALSFAVPAERLSDGTQVFIVRDPKRDEPVGQFSLQSGPTIEADIAAEVELLRAELDLLKRAFRRHCTETAD